ncbi:MAG: succinylglutamate desuccinylase/aspartoacylase family protein [Kordiimonadaceae bacterium]|nr:succinylglutamate desuccinylase/aspartoacylase family protein [Kordiimonadaceae bacterium]MBO6567887.1 succinylglutamate desuccinylase/aspartoacylase family protein [Kordiimonadaceae bacterium]MBO6964383.1 succinylglutamate desuccinylase/aspartoacylase family protein [Kordiimonadaceae bacterium]
MGTFISSLTAICRVGWVALLLLTAQSALALNANPTSDSSAVQRLEVADLAPGLHRLRFNAGSRNTGERIWVPIVVVKGEQSGPSLMITAGVHGDELNGIATIHGLLQRIEGQPLTGTLVLIPGFNQPGMNANNRHFVGAGGGGSMTDLNRIFPGRLLNGSVAERYVAQLWRNVLKDNATYAIDLHTQTRGSDYPLFVFSDFRNSMSRQIAFDLGPDVIKNDPGQSGSLETTMMEIGVPAVTFEIGGPKKWQPDLIERAVDGIENVMRGLEMLEGERTEPPVEPIVGANSTNIFTDYGGFAYIHVKLKDPVRKGQLVATIVDAYGRKIADYVSPYDGIVLSVATDPLREPGAMLVRILH